MNQQPGVVTVSPIGSQSVGLTSSVLTYGSNNGADFGPDTSGTQTSGIQEALNWAAANGYAKVLLLSGGAPVASLVGGPATGKPFVISAKILWPIGWSGTLEGEGPAQASAGASTYATSIELGSGFNDTAMLTLQNTYPGGGNTTNKLQIRNIKFRATSAGVVTYAVLDLQQNDNQHDVVIENVWADALSQGCTYSIDFSGNQVSVLSNVYGISKPLKWYTSGGSARIINGQYDSGMILLYQGCLIVGTLLQYVQVDNPGGAGGNLATRNSMTLVMCYKNHDTVPLFKNNAAAQVWVTVIGGQFNFDAGTAIFSALASSGQINLSLVGPSFNIATGSMTLFDTTCTTHQIRSYVGVNFQGTFTLNDSAASTLGLGIGNQIGTGFKVAWTGAATDIIPAKTVDANVDSFVLVTGQVESTTADTVTVQVTYTDAVNGATPSVSVVNAVALGANGQQGFVFPATCKAGTTIKVSISTASQTTTKASAVITRMI